MCENQYGGLFIGVEDLSSRTGDFISNIECGYENGISLNLYSFKVMHTLYSYFKFVHLYVNMVEKNM